MTTTTTEMTTTTTTTTTTDVTEAAPKFWDAKNSTTCSRCGGSGYMPFSAYNGVCFRCNARGWTPITPKGQAPLVRKLTKAGAVIAELGDARVGDIIYFDKTAAVVTRITWRNPGKAWKNQVLHLARVLDGAPGRIARRAEYTPSAEEATSFRIKTDADGKEYHEPCMELIPVSEAMVGQEATQDASGAWVRF